MLHTLTLESQNAMVQYFLNDTCTGYVLRPIVTGDCFVDLLPFSHNYRCQISLLDIIFLFELK